MTGDLAAFLAARLDEDEAAAGVASRFPHWHGEPWYDGQFLKDGRTQRADLWGAPGMQFTGHGALDTVVVDHIARHDPARVLREVAAKRAILSVHRVVEYPGPYVPISPTCSICITEREGYQEEWGDDDWPCATIRLLAAVYSDHPDYRQEWAPHE